jgi:hypothetical protein
MKAHQADGITLTTSHIDESTMDAELLEVNGQDGEQPFLGRWADSQTGGVFQDPHSAVRVGTTQGQASRTGGGGVKRPVCHSTFAGEGGSTKGLINAGWDFIAKRHA